MNGQHNQAYLNLINQLLFCNGGDATQILRILIQNIDKIDNNLLNALDNWQENHFLDVDNNQAISDANAILDFSNSIKNFPLGDIATNKELAIKGYHIALSIFTFETSRENWAMTQNNLGNAYRNRIRESKAENLEKAISCYDEALNVYTEAAFPQQWATVQHNLGNVYGDRIIGDKANNLERAITFYNEALKVRTLDTCREDWAMTKSNLAVTYIERIKENKSENLEQAISYCNEALQVYTLESFSQEWATVQNTLATAYFSRIKGDKAENLEQAILFYNNALNVYNIDIAPADWATTQNNLASAYLYRIKGDKAENLEQAILFCNNASTVYTSEAFPQQWATTQNNLATVYFSRIKGHKAENLEQAILFCNNASTVYTSEAFPQQWATTQNNLASAYLYRIKGDKEENLEQAILFCNNASTVYTLKAFPQQWATTRNNLAIAYRNRIKGDKAKNLEEAISCCVQALKIHNFNNFPLDWATLQNNLGNIYFDKIEGNKADNVQQAIFHYSEALKVYKFDSFPQDCLKTARNLANLHYREKQWQPATEFYDIAIKAVENTRLEAFNPQSRQEVLSNAIDVFHRIVQAYLNLNQPEKALEYIERSKGRNLVELMTQKALKPKGVSQETIDKLVELKQQVVNEQIRLQYQSINQNLMVDDNLTPYVQDQSYLKIYKEQLDTFIAEKITPYDSTFCLTQTVQPIPFEEIKALTDESTCLLQWYITGEKILAFVVSKDGTVNYWESSKTNWKSLDYVLRNYLTLYDQYKNKEIHKWQVILNDCLESFARILHINHIIALIPETCQRLIIIPHRFLHILPLHALPIDKNYILHDKYDIQYAPSSQLLQITQQRPLNKLNHLFAIQNPTRKPSENLPFSDLEVKIISTFFDKKEIIAKDDATNNTVKTQIKTSESNCYLFSCHGNFQPNNPLDSALLLANKDKLTLSEIFELDLHKSRLVVLSACETGLIDLSSISDEYIGLSAGFLFAGSLSFVSSLWQVSDLSTSFLMIKFYEIILDKTQTISISVALKMAQNWLRNLTVQEFDSLLEKYQTDIDKILEPLTPRIKEINKNYIQNLITSTRQLDHLLIVPSNLTLRLPLNLQNTHQSILKLAKLQVSLNSSKLQNHISIVPDIV